MALYGYARVSTLEQDLRIQRAALKAAGCDVIRAEKATGTRSCAVCLSSNVPLSRRRMASGRVP